MQDSDSSTDDNGGGGGGGGGIPIPAVAGGAGGLLLIVVIVVVLVRRKRRGKPPAKPTAHYESTTTNVAFGAVRFVSSSTRATQSQIHSQIVVCESLGLAAYGNCEFDCNSRERGWSDCVRQRHTPPCRAVYELILVI